MSESDQRAATSLFARLPARPDAAVDPAASHAGDGDVVYARIAAELRAQIASGELPVGAQLPTHKQLAEQYGISTGTAHRVTALLSNEGLVEVSRGRRATVIQQPLPGADQAPRAADGVAAQRRGTVTETAAAGGAAAMGAQLWAITLRGPDGHRYPARHGCGDIARLDSFRAHLLAIARIERPTDTDHGEAWIGDYELELREPGKEHEDPKLTLRWQKN